MSHYDVNYPTTNSQSDNDEKALKDIHEYNDKVIELIVRELTNGRVKNFQEINVAFGMVGVVGYPVHAFGRIYCTELYNDWMAD
jgi:hypothetical protein